jgi:hypothetical protein
MCIPSAGPIRVPLRNHPRAVPRSVYEIVNLTFIDQALDPSYRPIDVSNNGRPEHQKRSPLKRRQDTEDEERGEIRRHWLALASVPASSFKANPWLFSGNTYVPFQQRKP